jgi:hypothetical protein
MVTPQPNRTRFLPYGQWESLKSKACGLLQQFEAMGKSIEVRVGLALVSASKMLKSGVDGFSLRLHKILKCCFKKYWSPGLACFTCWSSEWLASFKQNLICWGLMKGLCARFLPPIGFKSGLVFFQRHWSPGSMWSFTNLLESVASKTIEVRAGLLQSIVKSGLACFTYMGGLLQQIVKWCFKNLCLLHKYWSPG